MLQKYYDVFYFFAVFDMSIGLYAIKHWCDEVPVRFYIYIIMVGISRVCYQKLQSTNNYK